VTKKKKEDEDDVTENHLKRVAEEIKHLEVKSAKIVQASRNETKALNDELKKLREVFKNSRINWTLDVTDLKRA